MPLRRAAKLGLFGMLVCAAFLLGLALGCRYALKVQAEKDADVLVANLEAINRCLKDGCDPQLQQAVVSQNDIALLSYRTNETLLDGNWLLGSVGAALLYYGHIGVEFPASQNLIEAYEKRGCGIHGNVCVRR